MEVLAVYPEVAFFAALTLIDANYSVRYTTQ